MASSGQEATSTPAPRLAQPKLLQTLDVHKSDVNWCSFKGETLATCSADKTVRLWRMESNSVIESDSASPLVGHTYYVHCCHFSPCGRLLASSSTDGRVILWNVQNGGSVTELSHDSRACIKICCFSPDGRRLLTGSDDETLALWDVAAVYEALAAGESAEENAISHLRSFVGHEGTIFAACFSPDGELVVSGCSNGDVRLWDALFGHDPPLLELNDAHDLGVTVCVFAPPTPPRTEEQVEGGGSGIARAPFMLASAGNCNTVTLWSVSTFPSVSVIRIRKLVVHVSSVSSVAFSPRGDTLASASTDKTIAVWDVASGQLLLHWEAHSRYLTSCAFHPRRHDDQEIDDDFDLLLASGSNDKTVKIWSIVREGKEIESPKRGAASKSDARKVDPGKPATKTIKTPAGTPVAKRKKRISEWTVDEVFEWMRGTEGLKEYAETFRTNAIDGQELANLDNQALIELGVSALGHRNKITRALQKLLAHPYLAFPSSSAEIPDEYLCPITHEIMTDPVIAADGYSYERGAIEAWLRSGARPGESGGAKLLSPMTNSELASSTLTPNRSLRLLIQRFQS